MRKRILLVVLILALIFTGCSKQAPQADVITVYFPYGSSVQNKSLGIGSETRGIGEGDRLKAAVDAISGSPQSSTLKPLFPEGVKILSYSADSGNLNLYVSDEYANMSMGSKAITRSCLALTLCGINGVESISIYVGDIPDIKNLKAQDVLIENTKLNPYEARVKLLFSDGTKLCPEYRDVTLAKEHPNAYYVMQELLKGPQDTKLSSALPQGTTMLSLTLSGGICTVNLSGEFISKQDAAHSPVLAAYSIVNTLTVLNGVNKVQILVNGEKINSYTGLSIYYPMQGNTNYNRQ